MHSAEFKARVAVSALGGSVTVAELARTHGLSRNLVSRWRDQLVANAARLFAVSDNSTDQDEGMIKRQQARIQSLERDLAFLDHALGR